MTKVLYLIDSLPFGGAERQLSILLKYLPPAWERRVVALGGGPYHQVLLDQKIPVDVYQRRTRYDLSPVSKLFADLRRRRPDIVHSWGGLCSALAAPMCRILGIPMIDGSIRIGGAPSRHYWRMRVMLSLADYVVANSHAGLMACKTPPEKGSVVFNAFDPGRLHLSKPGASDRTDVTTVVMTGRITRFKDFSTFFEAARQLDARQPRSWRFVALGAGSEEDHVALRQMAGNAALAGPVELPRAGLEVLPYLQDANIGVLLSAACFKEGISNSIMEYMVAGLPVICSDSGGNRELVLDGETGFVVPSEDVEAFIEKLSFLRDHPDAMKKMGQAGYARVTSLCSVERMISDYEAIYAKLLRGRAKMPRETPETARAKG